MKTGMSSACFYPLETELSVIKCGELGFRNIEIFVNSYCELKGKIFKEIKSAVNHYGINVCSVHPFTSFAESFVFFGSYNRRVDDGIEFYKNYFEFCAELGASALVLHGAKLEHTVNNEEYFDRYARLFEAGKEFGVLVSQENVVNFRSQSVDFLKRMNEYLNGEFSMTLDLKQCRRAGEDPVKIIETIGEKILNVHISDYNENSDCIPPFEGKEDFQKIVNALNKKNFKGNYIIELYNNGYEDEKQIVNAGEKFDKIILE